MLFRWLVKLNSLKHTSEELKEKLNIIVIHDFSCTIAFHSISFWSFLHLNYMIDYNEMKILGIGLYMG